MFVINPISGGRSKHRVESSIIEKLDHSIYEYEMAYSNAVDHARKLSKSAAYLGFDVVVAVGGDGTVNEVARGLLSINSHAALGVIPFGSGNGLARHLGIPMDIEKAIEVLNKHDLISIDTAVMNEEPFFNVAGTGFDAHISFLFANDKKRGLWGYAKAVLNEFANYKPQKYAISIDGKLLERNAFMLSIANSSQFGNNAHIAPHASLVDGVLDIAIVKPFPLYQFPVLAFRLLARNVDKSDYVEIIKGSEIKIKRLEAGPIHLDGEPREMGAELEIKVRPGTLNVLKN
ncbi:lipid kinase, YegS/Rv2252/BmrU family [Solitalea koreensis]|uniref:Lipid kinase, YegS/Rv2252/BmrU family n=1 Tax=Solitalea koreensis TaxID=543615 RepID=A0A521C630_9SPHI|nr:lipid kinase, YegS/Rv2252/BmrU family [Solitalea koreensis]